MIDFLIQKFQAGVGSLEASFITATFVFLAWLLKSGYEKYIIERKNISKLQIITATNQTYLVESKRFISALITSLEKGELWANWIEELDLVDEKIIETISNIELLNRTIKLNIWFNRYNGNIVHLWSLYTDFRKLPLSEKSNAVEAIKKGWVDFRTDISMMEECTFDYMAYIRCLGMQKTNFLLSPLYSNIYLLISQSYPRINRVAIDKEKLRILREIEDK